MCLCLSLFLPANLASLYLAGESKAIIGRISHLFSYMSGKPGGCDVDFWEFPAFHRKILFHAETQGRREMKRTAG